MTSATIFRKSVTDISHSGRLISKAENSQQEPAKQLQSTADRRDKSPRNAAPLWSTNHKHVQCAGEQENSTNKTKRGGV